MTAPGARPLKVAFYLPHLHVGGAETVFVRLAQGLAEAGVDTCFVLDRGEGELLSATRRPVYVLGAKRTLNALPRLARWLRQNKPDALLSAISHNNIIAVLARAWAGVPTAIVVGEHSLLTQQLRKNWKFRVLRPLIRALYPRAAAIVAVSQAGRRDVEDVLGRSLPSLHVLPNPVVGTDVDARCAAPAPHPWLTGEGQPPVFVAAGRLIPLKDFPTLIRAFAKVAAERACRLIILGEGAERAGLEALCVQLNLADRIALPGTVLDPLPWFARAAAVVSASRYEGFGLTLVEAMACGTAVVTTEAGGPPAELVAGLGPVARTGDADSLAVAMQTILDTPPAHAALRERAAGFTLSASVAAYQALLRSCVRRVDAP